MNKLKQKIKDKLGEKKTASLKKTLNIARIVKNVVCWTMVAILTLAIVVFVITKLRGDTPVVFGYSLHRIVSGSMEPTLKIGDVIISKQVTDTSDIAVDDIITFQGDSRFDNQKVTHRVLVTPYNAGKSGIVLVTKGDANDTDDGEINFSSVESKYVIKLGILSDIYDFFFSPWGLIIFIFLLLLIFFDEIMNIVRIIASGREQEEPETLYEIVERLQREQQENGIQKTALSDDSEHNDIAELNQEEINTANALKKAVDDGESFSQSEDGLQPKKNGAKKPRKKGIFDKKLPKKEKQKKKGSSDKKKTEKTSVKGKAQVKKKTKKKSKKRKKRKKR